MVTYESRSAHFLRMALPVMLLFIADTKPKTSLSKYYTTCDIFTTTLADRRQGLRGMTKLLLRGMMGFS
jgi:hypothetical protein